jgi:hypothetical protein
MIGQRAEQFMEKVFPTFSTVNAELGSILFLAHARCNNYMKGQQVAINLSKHFPDSKIFFYWYVVSMAMRGVVENNVTSIKMASKLLQRNIQATAQEFSQYMKKQYGRLGETKMGSSSTAAPATKKKKKKGKTGAVPKEETKEDNQKKLGLAEVMRFYIWTLQQQQSYEQIIDEVLLNDEPFGWLLEPIPYDRKTMLAENAIKAEKYIPLSNALYAHLIQQFDTDEWTWWTGYLDSLFLLIDNKEIQQQTTEKVVKFQQDNLKYNTTAQEAKDFITEMQKKDTRKRGAYLAMLELNRRLIQKYSNESDKKDLQVLLLDYFVSFAGKTVFFEDVKAFLVNLDNDAAQSFLQQCRDHITKSDKLDAEIQCILNLNVRKMERNFFIQQRSTNPSLQPDPKLWSLLISEYVAALSLGTTLEKTQNQHGDEFLILATHYLLDHDKELNKQNIITSILLLEFALKRAAYNFQIKCLLIRLYALLELPLESFDIFMTNYKSCGGTNMDIKHIQWETLSYLIYYDLSRLGQMEKLSSLVEEVLIFYRLEHSLESADLLLLAYRNQTFSKVYEFIRFGDRMNRSFMVHVALMDEILDNVITTHTDVEPKNLSNHFRKHLTQFSADFSPEKNQFSRNEDVAVLLDYGSKEVQDKILVPHAAQANSKSEDQQIWEKYYFIRCICHATDLINHISTSYANVEQFRSDIETWRTFSNSNFVVSGHVFDAVLNAFEGKSVTGSLEQIIQLLKTSNNNTTDSLSNLEQTTRFIQRDLVLLDTILPQIVEYVKEKDQSSLALIGTIKKEIQTYCSQTSENYVNEEKKRAKAGQIFSAQQDHLKIIDEILASQDKSRKVIVRTKDWNSHVTETLKRMNDSMIQTLNRVTRVLPDIQLNMNVLKIQ